MTGRVYYSLYDRLLHEKALLEAFKGGKASQGSSGIDRESLEEFESDLGEEVHPPSGKRGRDSKREREGERTRDTDGSRPSSAASATDNTATDLRGRLPSVELWISTGKKLSPGHRKSDPLHQDVRTKTCG